MNYFINKITILKINDQIYINKNELNKLKKETLFLQDLDIQKTFDVQKQLNYSVKYK